MADTSQSAAVLPFVASRPRCICSCWGAKCRFCGTWLTKHDYTKEDALACAASVEHRCH